MNWSLQLITLLTCTMLGWSGEAVLTLPPTAQRHIDTLNAEITKAEEEKNQKVNRAVDKAIKSLNNLVRDAKTAQERRAIDDEILRLEEIKAANPPKDSVLGKIFGSWVFTNERDWTKTITIRPENTFQVDDGRTGTWILSNDSLVLSMPDNETWLTAYISDGQLRTYYAAVNNNRGKIVEAR